MKKLLLVLAVITSLTINAQWTKGYYVDEFGDKTEKSHMHMRAVGTFSNSATQNSKCVYDFYDSGNSITVDVREYGSSMATSIGYSFEIVKIKTPSGEVETIDNVFFSKPGVLFFFDEGKINTYTQLKSILTESGKYVMVFKKSGKYSSSSYKAIIQN